MWVYFVPYLHFGIMQEGIAKQVDDKRLVGNAGQFNDDISLFYSDIMPLLVSTL